MKRYIIYNDGSPIKEQESPDGDWCRAVDVEQLQAEALLLREYVTMLHNRSHEGFRDETEYVLNATPETAKAQAVLEAAEAQNISGLEEVKTVSEWVEVSAEYKRATLATNEAVRARRENINV